MTRRATCRSHGPRAAAWRCLGLLALLLAVLLFPPLAAARADETPLFPPGSRVGMVPPSGFEVSADFMGFADAQARSSIVIQEAPVEAFGNLRSALTPETLAAQGMTLLGPCESVTGSFEHRCFRLVQKLDDFQFRKWLMIAKLGSVTALVAVTLPEPVVMQGIHDAGSVESALSTLAYSEAPGPAR